MSNTRIPRPLPYVACVLSFIVLSFYLYAREDVSMPSIHVPTWWPSADSNVSHAETALPTQAEDEHPILELVGRAEREFEEVLAKETFDLAAAAQQYRERRGRQPPPGFDRWWQYARDHNGIIVEDFWDQIYHDLNPLWALRPEDMLRDVRRQASQIRIRGGNVSHLTDHFWMPIWEELIQTVAQGLPDIDLAMNTMDEPRMWVPWEKMSGYVDMERSGRKVVEEHLLVDQFSGECI